MNKTFSKSPGLVIFGRRRDLEFTIITKNSPSSRDVVFVALPGFRAVVDGAIAFSTHKYLIERNLLKVGGENGIANEPIGVADRIRDTIGGPTFQEKPCHEKLPTRGIQR